MAFHQDRDLQAHLNRQEESKLYLVFLMSHLCF